MRSSLDRINCRGCRSIIRHDKTVMSRKDVDCSNFLCRIVTVAVGSCTGFLLRPFRPAVLILFILLKITNKNSGVHGQIYFQQLRKFNVILGELGSNQVIAL